MQIQAMEHQGLPEAGRKDGFSPTAFKGWGPAEALILHLEPLERTHFHCSEP